MTTQTRIIAIAPAFLLAAFIPAQSAETESAKPASGIEGTWRWHFTMPDGTTTRPKLKLTTEDGKLTGTTSFRPGTETPITNIVLNSDEIRFQVIRHREDQEIVTTYSGKWAGKTLKGKIESNWAGEKQTFDWNAERAHIGAEGVWAWTNRFSTFGGGGGGGGGRFGRRGFETRVELEQHGELLTGATVGRFPPRTEIKNGSITNNEVYFELERGFGDNKYIAKFKGKQNGDIIKGTMEAEIDGEERKSEWEAKRVD